MPDEITFKPRTAANRHVEDQATIDALRARVAELEAQIGLVSAEITEAKPMPRLTKLIAEQALKIYNLEAEVTRMEDDRRSIRMIIYCIGGPLNDNVRGYTRDQMVPFAQIAEHAAE